MLWDICMSISKQKIRSKIIFGKHKVCRDCNGSGKVTIYTHRLGTFFEWGRKTCPVCEGKGVINA
jgi:DnaJ-class molecular chaperone